MKATTLLGFYKMKQENFSCVWKRKSCDQNCRGEKNMKQQCVRCADNKNCMWYNIFPTIIKCKKLQIIIHCIDGRGVAIIIHFDKVHYVDIFTLCRLTGYALEKNRNRQQMGAVIKADSWREFRRCRGSACYQRQSPSLIGQRK